MTTRANVFPDDDGTCSVQDGDGNIVASGLSNEDAWKLADRMNEESYSRSEHVADWLSKRGTTGL